MDNKPSPLVSVITPFFNEEQFLVEAIESVIKQQYIEWELILVDDGSSDNSTHIARNYANANAGKIIYTDHENHRNRGSSASRNHGVSKARGEFVAFLDADDIWFPQKLQTQVSIMLLHREVEMLCEAAEYWYSDFSDKTKPNEIKQVGTEWDRVFFPPSLVAVLYPLSDGQAPCPSGIIARRTTILKHGGFEEHFTGKYQLYEDQAFLYKIYLNEPVYLSSLCNHRYRQRQGSLTRKAIDDGNYHVARRYFLEWLEQYVNKSRPGERRVKGLITRALEPYRYPYIHSMRKFSVRMIKALKRRLPKWLRH